MTEPFLRWAGGKRWLARRLSSLLLPRLEDRYIEPFLGAGAVFFALAPHKAWLSDINQELISAYSVVASQARSLELGLSQLTVDAETYYAIRSHEPDSDFERALQFLYLNRTCYGGLYRTNRMGRFNVPYGGGGRTPEIVVKKRLLQRASLLLRREHVRIKANDFEVALDLASRGDVVYCDPVYSTPTIQSFDRYNPRVFSWPEQVRLRNAAYRAMGRGALVVVSNALTPEIAQLYPDAKRIVVQRKKAIGNPASDHRKASEYVIVLDPRKQRTAWSLLGTVEATGLGAVLDRAERAEAEAAA